MNRRRLISLVVAALLVLAAALYVASQRNAPHDVQGLALYPTLRADMASVDAVTVRKGGGAAAAGSAASTGPAPGALTIHKTGEVWTVAERGDYPADLFKLRKLLTAMSDAKIVEEKTSDPTRYDTLGVQDLTPPAGAGTSDAIAGTQITVSERDKKLSLIVGKPVGDGNFVRRVGEKPSYRIEPAVFAPSAARDWIDSRLIDVATQRVQSIDVKPVDGPAYRVHREAGAKPIGQPSGGKPSAARSVSETPGVATPGVATPGAAPPDSLFSLDGVPAGRTALDANALAPGPTLFAALTAEDVAPAAEIDFTHSAQAVVTLTDGGVMTLTGTVAGDKHWLKVQFPADAALDAKAHGRAFEIASYRYDAIFKPLEQLLVPKPPRASGKGATASPSKPHVLPRTTPAAP